MTRSNVMSEGELRAVLSTFPQRILGALVHPGFHALDLWGPLEMFGDLAPAVSPLLIGSRNGPVASAQGPMAVADVAIGESPRLDLLLIPAGERIEDFRDTEILEWLSWQASDAEIVMAVGNSADLLAGTRLLEGRRATASEDALASIAAVHPTVTWVANVRWVEDGKFVTCPGGFAAIDMSLAVIGRLTGERVAATLAHRTGYRWIGHPKPPGLSGPTS